MKNERAEYVRKRAQMRENEERPRVLRSFVKKRKTKSRENEKEAKQNTTQDRIRTHGGRSIKRNKKNCARRARDVSLRTQV